MGTNFFETLLERMKVKQQEAMEPTGEGGGPKHPLLLFFVSAV